MDNTYHSLNNATHLNQSSNAEAAPIDPKETASRGKPPGQAEAGVQKSPAQTPTSTPMAYLPDVSSPLLPLALCCNA